MEETSRNDIRKFLKTFGIQADEAIVAHLARNPGIQPLRLRITLSDLTDYETPPNPALHLEMDGEIQR